MTRPSSWSNCSGATACARRCGRSAIRRPSSRSGRRRGACPRRPTGRWSGPVRITIRSFAWLSRCRTASRPKASAVPSARPSRLLLPPCSSARAYGRIAPMVDVPASDQASDAPVTRCAFIALIGAPNAGKSTLINALVGSKVAIVTPKVQTTRALLRGIAMAGSAQLVLIDTPGIFAPRRRLDRAMVTTAWSGAHDADIVAVLIDAKKGLDDEAEALLKKLDEVRQPKALILNKV